MASECYLVTFNDDYKLKMYAKSEAEIKHIVAFPKTIASIEVIDPSTETQGETDDSNHARNDYIETPARRKRRGGYHIN